MKKIIFILFVALSFIGYKTNAQNIKFEKLPNEAQKFINTNFKSSDILYIEEDREILDSKYEVVFSSGGKIEFNNKGHWSEIKFKNGIPENIIPKSIAEFVKTKHQNNKIIQIEKDRKKIEVKLDNKIELLFDSKGEFIRYDD